VAPIRSAFSTTPMNLRGRRPILKHRPSLTGALHLADQIQTETVPTAKAALFTTRGLAVRPKSSERRNVVAGPCSQFGRHAHTQAPSELPIEERALWEAAIQLDLVTVSAGEAQVTQGRTVAAWMAGQKPATGGQCKGPRPPEYFGRVRGYRKRARAVAPTAQTVVWTLRSFPKEFNHPPALLGQGNT
jgi:hypothetical protein